MTDPRDVPDDARVAELARFMGDMARSAANVEWGNVPAWADTAACLRELLTARAKLSAPATREEPGGLGLAHPTHWMPLPAPPATDKEDAHVTVGGLLSDGGVQPAEDRPQRIPFDHMMARDLRGIERDVAAMMRSDWTPDLRFRRSWIVRRLHEIAAAVDTEPEREG